MISDLELLNANCACISLDKPRLWAALDAMVDEPGFGEQLAISHPTLVSNSSIFVPRSQLERMAEAIAAIEMVAKLPAYQAAAIAAAPAIAAFDPGTRGVLMGYDFHLAADGPKLIEINTNAGGSLVNAVLGAAQKACCLPVEPLLALTRQSGDQLDLIMRSFTSEWRLARGDRTLTTIAIVDTAPESQYLHPEFVLFQRLFRQAGFEAVIAAPQSLVHADGRLSGGNTVIDLVYNRLTDFSLDAPECAALRAAYLAGDVVLTPHPRVHALLADKRNLVRLSDPALLRSWNVEDRLISVLGNSIPRTVEVTRERAGELWEQRARLFFKPAAGFGSRAAYRGDKLTRRVWDNIVAGGYIAQTLIPASARNVVVDGKSQPFKIDVRNYCYDGQVQLVAARLYRGQTTNMRTPGGGFSPVLATPEDARTLFNMAASAMRCAC